MLVMTTLENYSETYEFFQKNDFFGGRQENFIFFKQSMLPAISTEGKIYMKSKSDISMSPNGNGALLSAIHMNQEIRDYIETIDYI